jgi:hypothetical protein
MAMTRMLAGVCTAGFTTEPHATSHLHWIRPVKEHGNLLLGDMTGEDGHVIQVGDVVRLNLRRARSVPPHTEDWITDFVYRRPCLLRRLEGGRRAKFLAEHVDRAPQEVLGRQPTRSLCLVKPDRIWACFKLDPYSLKYQARLGFELPGLRHRRANSPGGIAVTDLKWRALGRTWLDADGGELALDQAALCERLGAEEVYLSLGLSRGYQDKLWLLVIGVHAVPDYDVEIDYDDL